MDKAALTAFLRDRRDSLKPGDYGFDCEPRRGRRVPGLSQEQVASLLGRPLLAYQRLESGNYPNPPVDLLEAVARLYGLSEEQWKALNYFARGAEPPSPLHAHSSLELPGGWQDAVECYTSMAYLTDHRWNVLVSNKAWSAMFPRRQTPANTMRWMLCEPEARTVLTDWDTAWAPRVAPQLRAARAALPYDDVLADLEDEVLSDPDAGPIYEAVGDVQVHPDGAERPLWHAEQGPGWVSLYAAAPMSAPHARLMMMTFHPGDKPRNFHRPPLRAPDPERERTPPHVPGVPGSYRTHQ